MPINRLLPDGNVEIINSKTGEIKAVAPADLPKYSPKLVPAYQAALQKQQQVESAAKAVGSGQMGLADIPQDQRVDVVSKVTSENNGKVPTSADLAQQAKNKGVATAAKNYLDTYNQLVNSGADLNSEDAKRKLSYAAGKYNSVAGFGEGGKVLSAAELGILAPTLIKTERQREQNFIERLSGTQPEMTKGYLQEDPNKAAEKMKLALQATNPELAKQYANVGVQKQQQTQGGNAPSNPLDYIIGAAKNVPGNAKDIINSILTIPSQAKALQEKYGSMTPAFLSGNPQAFQTMVGGALPAMPAAQEANQFAGEPLKGGDVVQRALNRAYEKPVNTAMDVAAVLPFLKGPKGAPVEGQPVSDATGLMGQLKGTAQDIQGRAATSVSVPDPESVVRSESLMKDALQATKSNTPRGMAKELESKVIPKAGEFIDKHVASIDKQIGPQPGEDVVNTVMDKLKQSSELTANPQHERAIQSLLERELRAGGPPEGGLARGETWSTSMERMNNARKYLNSGLDNWFKNGQPTGNPTNDLNSLKWQASQALKDLMGETDQTGLLRKAIGLQHTALSTSPQISKAALADPLGGGGLWRMAIRAINDVVTPAKVAGARALQGSNPTVNQILQPGVPLENPGVVGGFIPEKMVRDMRYKQGNPQFK